MYPLLHTDPQMLIGVSIIDMFVWEMYEDEFLSFSKKNESRENNFLGWGELEREKIIFRQLIFFRISKKLKVGRIIFFWSE